MSNRSDLVLAQAVLDGDASAFHKLYDFYLPPVFAFARRHRTGEAEARRLAARILEAVFAHLEGYSGRTSFAAWVLAVARLVEQREARASEPEPEARSA